MIAIASMFHNAAAYISRYALQIHALRALLPPSRLILAHAHCADPTPRMLAELFPDAAVLDRTDPALPVVPHSVDTRERWRSIAHTANGILEALRGTDDVLIWVESDLIWDAAALARLYWHLGTSVDGVAPMVADRQRGARMYDTWGHRGLDGVCFGHFPPYHPKAPQRGLFPVSSAGSAWAVRASYASFARYNDEGIVGWCRAMGAAGARLFVDLDTWVEHP